MGCPDEFGHSILKAIPLELVEKSAAIVGLAAGGAFGAMIPRTSVVPKARRGTVMNLFP
jgi:hypothetical protein